MILRMVLLIALSKYYFNTNFISLSLLLVLFLSALRTLPALRVASDFRWLTTPSLSNLLIANRFDKLKGVYFQWCCSLLKNKNGDKFGCQFVG